MNVLLALIVAIPVQDVTILMEVTPALATLDTQAMDFLAQVSALFVNLFLNDTDSYTIFSKTIKTY